MKRGLLFLCFCVISITMVTGQQIRVACIGNGFTYGTGINKRELNSYPAQLQRMLGEQYLVRNFGVEGATVYSNSENSYIKTDEYKQSRDFEPEIIIINFGMEEARSGFESKKEQFIKDYKNMAFRYFNLPTALRVIIMKPAPSFDTYGKLKNEVIAEEVIPSIEEVAFSSGSEIIDTYSLFFQGEGFYSDNINISAAGANRVALSLYESINFHNEHDYNFMMQMSVENTRSEFNGYVMYDFQVYGWDCKMVSPKRTASGMPWIWRSGAWGEHVETDLLLLQMGYHLVYIDTEGLYGNPAAVERWNRFYNFMQEGGMADKMVLAGYGESSVVALNWALENKEKVQAIYLEDPVVDFTSWPKGLGKARADSKKWEAVLKAYGKKSGKKEQPFKESPINKSEAWKTSGIPFFFTCTRENPVIVPEENAQVFFSIPEIKSISVLQFRNNDGSGYDPVEAVRFLQSKSGNSSNIASLPFAGYESRYDVAGWASGADWWDNHREIADQVAIKKPQIIFLGNSIVQAAGGRESVTRTTGEEVFYLNFSGYSWVNAGIGGDRIGQIMYRVIDGEYGKSGARQVVITAGINDFPEESAEDIAKGLWALVELVREEMPRAKILFTGPLPAGIDPNHVFRNKGEAVHRLLSTRKWPPSVTYRPITKEFLDNNNRLDKTYYQEDGVHLTAKGYALWAEILYKEIEKNQ